MKVVVTGGTGFIGRHLAVALVKSDHSVYTISRRPTAADAGVIHHSCHVESPEAQVLAQRAEVVVHLAGQADASASLADPVLFARVNSSGTLNMLEAARRAGALFVLASSQRVYRPAVGRLSEDDPLCPNDPYGYTKLVAEQWVEMYRKVFGLRAIVLRFYSVYGPGQTVGHGSSGVVSIFMDRALAGRRILVNNANLRDFTYVSDVVKGILLCIDQQEALGQTFNVATGLGTSVGDLAVLIKDVAGSCSEIEVVGDSMDESYVANIDRIRRTLDYRPEVDLWQGLKRYYDSLRTGS